MQIIKPINLNRGQFITVENRLKNIVEKLELIQEKKKINVAEKKKCHQIKCEYNLIQKYLEKPLLNKERKFEIILWVLFYSFIFVFTHISHAVVLGLSLFL